LNPSTESSIRIGTWNLDGKWSSDHRAMIASQRCDAWLLTEVSTKALNDDIISYNFHMHHTFEYMTHEKYWSAILSTNELSPLPDPHTASAAALIGDVVFCSSILPWATCGSEPAQPWRGSNLEEKTKAAVEPIKRLLKNQKAVWGGDWNRNLYGGWEHVGSQAMQDAIDSVVNSLGLCVATRELPHRLDCSHTIDHIAIPKVWIVDDARRVSAIGLSDHDLYFIEVQQT